MRVPAALIAAIASSLPPTQLAVIYSLGTASTKKRGSVAKMKLAEPADNSLCSVLTPVGDGGAAENLPTFCSEF
jgi:hypothetical protein